MNIADASDSASCVCNTYCSAGIGDAKMRDRQIAKITY